MLSKKDVKTFAKQFRALHRTKAGAKIYGGMPSSKDETGLGPLELLVGEWVGLPGHGWNMIALPFATAPGEGFDYRLLLNQYDETLTFEELSGPVPNRGIRDKDGDTEETDQFIAALEYQQTITQIASADFPDSGLAGKPGMIIHEEPGLWLHMTNETTKRLDIARRVPCLTAMHCLDWAPVQSPKARRRFRIFPDCRSASIKACRTLIFHLTSIFMTTCFKACLILSIRIYCCAKQTKASTLWKPPL